METRDLWIDQPYAESTWRVRELAGGEIRTLAVFPTREQAQRFIERTLDPGAEAEPDSGPLDAPESGAAAPGPRPTWTRGVSP